MHRSSKTAPHLRDLPSAAHARLHPVVAADRPTLTARRHVDLLLTASAL